MNRKRVPSDDQLNRRHLREARMLRDAERGKGGPRVKPIPGRHWYKDRQSRGGVAKG